MRAASTEHLGSALPPRHAHQRVVLPALGSVPMTPPPFGAAPRLVAREVPAVSAATRTLVPAETQWAVCTSLVSKLASIRTYAGVIGLCPGPSTHKCCLAGSACTAPAVNTRTIDHVKLSEGFEPSPAPDPINLPTVGYGHLCQTSGCAEVPFSFPLTQAQATTLLISDLRTFQNCIARDIVDSVRLNDNQYGALVSWAFNVGCANSASSTLIRRLNAGETPNVVAEEELPKWNKAGGNVLPGLVTRRAREVTLFKTASSVIAHPPPC